MDKFRFLVQLPFMAQLLIPLLAMGLPVYQINRRGVGTQRIDAHLIKPSAWRSAFRAQLNAWRAFFGRMIPIAAMLLLTVALAHTLPDHADKFAALPMIGMGGTVDIRQLKQSKAEKDAKVAAIAVEMQGLLEVAFDKRTDEQKAKITALQADKAKLTTELAALTAEIALQEEYLNAHVGKPSVQVGKDRATERPWGPTLHADATPEMRAEALKAGLGEWAIAVKRASSGEGADPRLFAAATGMGSAIPSDGGFAVPHEMGDGIERDMFAGGELLSRVDVRTISGDSISYNVVDETSRATTRNGGVLGYWVDQGTAATATQPKLARIELKLRKVAALGYMTDELVADAAGLGGELQAMFGDELIFQVEDAIVEGTGAGMPLGYSVAPCLVSIAKESGQSAATINTTNLSKMWARMPARSQKNAVWIINVDVQPQLDMLSIPVAAGALEPRFVVYGPDGVMTIKGRPVIPVEYCATLGTVNDIALIDPSKYRLIRKGGVEQASSIHVRFTQGEQAFRAFYRCDGQPVPRAALTPFKGSNTLSPFINLATRS